MPRTISTRKHSAEPGLINGDAFDFCDVLEKCGFVPEDRLAGFADLPNLGSEQREDCLRLRELANRASPSST